MKQLHPIYKIFQLQVSLKKNSTKLIKTSWSWNRNSMTCNLSYFLKLKKTWFLIEESKTFNSPWLELLHEKKMSNCIMQFKSSKIQKEGILFRQILELKKVSSNKKINFCAKFRWNENTKSKTRKTLILTSCLNKMTVKYNLNWIISRKNLSDFRNTSCLTKSQMNRFHK